MPASSGQIVWTLKIRLLHWLMAAFVLLNLFLYNESGEIHNWLGYGTLAIIFFRALLGMTSNGFDGFRKFPLQPAELFYFFRDLFNGKRKDYTGHNPAAAYAYVVFWLLIIGLGITGILLVHVEEYFGSQALEEIHEIFANSVIVFMVVHLTGMALDAILHRRKSWMSMISGKK